MSTARSMLTALLRIAQELGEQRDPFGDVAVPMPPLVDMGHEAGSGVAAFEFPSRCKAWNAPVGRLCRMHVVDEPGPRRAHDDLLDLTIVDERQPLSPPR